MVAEVFCSTCHAPFLSDAPLDNEGRCALCRSGMLGFDAAFAFGEYAGSLRQLIHLFKYEKISTLAGPLAVLASRALPRSGEEYEAIVPMPLHWRKRRERGFNQSLLLASELSKRTGVPVRAVLRRVKATEAQAGLTGAQRRKNVAGAFAVRRPETVAGRHVLLIDDVLTTGATAGVCAAELKRNGARRVSVLTVARADRRQGFAGKLLT
ncbi:MAG TPA: ComF family protein [Bryobacteraceae bacterium]|nr:ComF family protein [Bryobacteraceae bacterium]